MTLQRCQWINVPAGSQICVRTTTEGDATTHARAVLEPDLEGAGEIFVDDDELSAGWCIDVPAGGMVTAVVFMTPGGAQEAKSTVDSMVVKADGLPFGDTCTQELTGKQGDPERFVVVIAAS